jgi:Xaa-Pro aminopeptidase
MNKNKITQLKKLIRINSLDGYVVPKNDAYFSEYSYPDRLKTLTNFSGSAGFAVILKKENYLFVDGRYTIQAQIQSGKNFKVLEVPRFSTKHILKKRKKKLLLGFDPQLFTNLSLKRKFANNFNLLPIDENLVDKICKKKSKKTTSSFYNLDHKISGESSNSKINRLIKIMNSKKIHNIFISAAENIAWLLNIRGEDNPHSPIPNCKIILTNTKKIFFFSCPKKINIIKKHPDCKKIIFCTHQNFSKIINGLKGNSFGIDSSTCSVTNENIIKKLFDISNNIDPCYTLKSIKNKLEIKSMIAAHIEDGLALTKFIYWIKNINKKKITEVDAQNKLEKFRKLNKNYLFPSFNTIAGTGSNGAIIHYRATKKTTKTIKKNDIFLCDSGGQYKYGTTDVTRTICFSNQKNSIKNIFTRVLKGHIAVVQTDLNHHRSGKQIDIRARKFLKEVGLDYAHGTGHGVGFFLNVHEGPQSISKYNSTPIYEGMILSNEPGFYKKGNFGIRIENLMYANKIKDKLVFENLTLAPIEKQLINYNLLSEGEKDYLFRYHLKIYTTYSKFLNLNERKWLASLI